MQKNFKSYTGEVVKGRQLGRTIGIPTINIFPTADASDLERGVYFSTIRFGSGKYRDKEYFGVTNVGCKPTVQNTNTVNFETFIFDFNDDVYGEEVIITPLFFKRPEIKFDSFEQLTLQIEQDVIAAEIYFKTNG